jgi:hypothetical protein
MINLKLTKKELAYIYKLVKQDLEDITEKRTLPVDYSDTAQNVELKVSALTTKYSD